MDDRLGLVSIDLSVLQENVKEAITAIFFFFSFFFWSKLAKSRVFLLYKTNMISISCTEQSCIVLCLRQTGERALKHGENVGSGTISLSNIIPLIGGNSPLLDPT